MKLVPGLTVLLTAALAFMVTENVKYLRHFHQPRFEFAFWVVFLFVMFSFILLAEDTPIKVNFESQLPALSVFGLAIPLMSAAIVEAYFAAGLKQFRGFDKEGNEVEIQMDPHDPSGLVKAQSKLRRLNNLLDNVMYNSQLRMFTAWVRGVLNERRKLIQDVIVDTTPEELNHILSSVNIPQLFTYGNYYSKQNSDTLEYIINERGRDLTIIARASLLHGLMRMHTLVFHEQQLKWAIDTLLGAKGSDLTLLKNLLDSSGDYNNLFKLVFVDINDKKKRDKVLEHINIQAKESIRLNKMAEKRSIKILSDIDDTLFSSGGVFPAGADTRFPRHAVYPGVLALFEEIDVYARTSGHVLTKKMRKSIKRLSRKRRSQGLDTANLKDTDEEFEGELKRMVEDTNHDFVVDTGSKVLVSIEMPWSQGGGVAQLSFDPNVSVSKIQQEVEAKFHLPPWKQNLIVTSDRPLYDDTDVHKWKHGNVVFVSARPHAYKDITENGSYRKFHKLIGAGRMHATPTLLAGDMTTGVKAVIIRTLDEFGVFLLNLSEAAWEVVKLGLSFGSRRRRRRRDQEHVEEGDERLSVRKILTQIGTRETTNRNWYGTGLSKAEKFEQYAMLYPEYSFVFFGDNGQGDLLAAEHMAQSSSGSSLLMSFIHDILPPNKLKRVLTSIGTKGKHKERNVWAERNIIFFRTYVGAAIEALEAGLIPIRGLYRVTRIAQAEMVHIIADSRNQNFDFSQAIEEINEDIERANGILGKQMEGDDFHPIPIVPV